MSQTAPPGDSQTGQPAAQRPYPPSTPAAPAPVDADAAGETTALTAPVPPAAAPPLTTAPVETRTGRRAARDDEAMQARRDLPEPPPKPGLGRHVLGAVVGLVLTPFALLLVGIGTARLADIAGTEDMSSDILGATLLLLGAALLAVIVLLGAWSAAVPIVGGLVWGIGLGTAYLVVPGVMEDAVQAMTADRTVPAAVDQLANGVMSGNLVVIGALLVAAGLATAIARRRGRRWAERVAAAETARADADRERLDEAMP